MGESGGCRSLVAIRRSPVRFSQTANSQAPHGRNLSPQRTQGTQRGLIYLGLHSGLLDKAHGKFYCEVTGRGTQVVRERSAKPLYVGSIPTRASSLQTEQPTIEVPRCARDFA